jgi:hypothetical protein
MLEWIEQKMNERILELAVQTGLYDDWNGRPYPRAMSSEECRAAYAKFAELIVCECSVIIQDYVDHRIPASEYPKQLKEHFGVNE